MNKPRRDPKTVKQCADRLRQARIDAHYETAREFALAVGYEEKDVGTYRHHENGHREFSKADARRYARKLKIVSAGFLLGLVGEEATEPSEVEVMGEAALAVWVDKSLDKERNKNNLQIPNPKGVAVRFAIFVKDQSVNKVLPEGEYAVCVPMDADDLEDGQLVYVEHTRGDLVQMTIRRVSSKAKGGFQLKTHSTNSKYESTLEYPSEKRDEIVILKGRVIGHYGEIDLV